MIRILSFLSIVLFVYCGSASYPNLEAPSCVGNVLPHSVIAPGFCPRIWASGLNGPRTLELASNGDVLTVESGGQQVRVLWDDNNDGVSSSDERAVLAQAPGLNHAVRINGAYVYASNATNVFRWPYTPGDRSNLGPGEIVIYNIPCCHHVTRALAFDASNLLYVQVGSASNVDSDALHARIKRFQLPEQIPAGGIDWESGELYANGLRNEAGIRFDKNWNLWGVENGVDNEYRADLGGDIHQTNPGEELNNLGTPGLFYGYPYCWSSFDLVPYPAGTQFYQNQFAAFVNDEWCQNTTNVTPPALSMHPHMAPLDILFWNNNDWDPTIAAGDAFIAFHGSWNSNPPAGYRLDHVIFDSNKPVINVPFLGYSGPGAYGNGWLRPVGLTTYPSIDGQTQNLLLSSDATGQIILISKNQ